MSLTRTCRASLLSVLAFTRGHPLLEPWGRQLTSTSSNALFSDQSIPVPAEPRRRWASAQVALVEIDRCWTERRATRRSRGVCSIVGTPHRSRSVPAGNGLGIIQGTLRATPINRSRMSRRHPNPGRVPYNIITLFLSVFRRTTVKSRRFAAAATGTMDLYPSLSRARGALSFTPSTLRPLVCPFLSMNLSTSFVFLSFLFLFFFFSLPRSPCAVYPFRFPSRLRAAPFNSE